jgi:hypothetical protein
MSKSTEQEMMEAAMAALNGDRVEIVGAIPKLKGFVVQSSDVDENTEGQEMYFMPPSGFKPDPVRVNLTIPASIIPTHLFRSHGRWCVAFDLVTDLDDLTLAADFWDDCPFSLKLAALLFFGEAGAAALHSLSDGGEPPKGIAIRKSAEKTPAEE